MLLKGQASSQSAIPQDAPNPSPTILEGNDRRVGASTSSQKAPTRAADPQGPQKNPLLGDKNTFIFRTCKDSILASTLGLTNAIHPRSHLQSRLP